MRLKPRTVGRIHRLGIVIIRDHYSKYFEIDAFVPNINFNQNINFQFFEAKNVQTLFYFHYCEHF